MMNRGGGNRRPPRRDRLVELVARQMKRRVGDAATFEELYDLGVPGLAVAHHAWDGRGNFEQFAIERIRWSMIDGLRKRSRDAQNMAIVAAELAAEMHPRTAEQISAGTGDVQHAAEESIDEILEDAGVPLEVDFDAVEKVENDVERIRLRRAISELPPPEDQVLERRLYEGETFQEVADALGLALTTTFEVYERGVQRVLRRFGRARLASEEQPTPP